ncbi:polysaccharide pyruvyl transferase family protein [Microbacterium sp. NPDC089987]|uniref:polysaccharide pyruvyl transferase family protein n=1 Tax=Microbacterium sp. NPDC089987 TaxID=3364202 RepID=UPI00381B85BD
MSVLTIGDIGVLSGMIHIGDEAMFEAARDELAARDLGVVGVSSAPEESAVRYGVPSVPRLGFVGLDRDAAARRSALLVDAAAGRTALDAGDPAGPVLDAIGDASGVLIAGGGNLASRWPVHVYERTTLAAMARARGLPVVVSGQTFGPDLEDADAERVAAMARAAALTGVREHASAELARTWGADVRAGVDDASFLGGGPMGDDGAGASDRVLVSLSGWFAGRPADEVERGIAALLDHAADTVGPVVFHAHFGPETAGSEPAGDAALHERVRARMRRPSDVLPSGDSLTAARLARTSRLLVTSRYHPAVFAAPAGSPILALAVDEYTRIKLSGALGHWGQDGVVDLDGLADAPARLTEIAASARATTDAAAERIDEHRAAAAGWWDIAVDALR